LTIYFDQATNTPIVGTKADVDRLLEFRTAGGVVTSLGANYDGEWQWQPLPGLVDVSDGVVTVNPYVHAVHTITTSASGSSESTTNMVLGGTYHISHSSSSNAAIQNTSNIAYDASAADVAAALEALSGVSSATVTRANVSAVGGYAWTVTFIDGDRHTLAVDSSLLGAGTMVATAVVVDGANDLRTWIERGDEIKVSNEVFNITTAVSSVYSESTLTFGSTYSGGNVVGQTAYRRSRSALILTVREACAQRNLSTGFSLFPNGALGYAYSMASNTSNGSNTSEAAVNVSAWHSYSAACLGTSPFSDTRVGGMVIAVKEAGNLRSEDKSSFASAATSVLSGSWGAHAAPAITLVNASDTGNHTGLNTGDQLVVTFDRHTNQPSVTTKAEIDTLLNFSASLGAMYSAMAGAGYAGDYFDQRGGSFHHG